MNRKFRSMLLVAVLFTLSIPAQAQYYGRLMDPNSITTNGEAEVRVMPDEVILTLGVETYDKVLKVAKTLNDDIIKKTIASAKNAGIPDRYIQTDYVNIEPSYNNYQGIRSGVAGYAVRKTVLITLKDIAKFEEILTAALESGVSHVHGIEFRTTELRKHRDEARRLALRAAKEKAELLAKEAGRLVGKISSVGESSFGYWSNYGSWWGTRYGSATQNAVQNIGGASIESNSTLSPGQIAIRATVSASFALE
jgi:uncharacterized protein YggE